jgi:hypothetical protein
VGISLDSIFSGDMFYFKFCQTTGAGANRFYNAVY